MTPSPYDQGYDAYRRGENKTACPFTDPERAKQWLDGYKYAEWALNQW